ncbi:Mu transposase C-terminal domain-containing protein [Pseudomonas resinovorans]|uniref:Mu transposase C-terminal domain-containing protein n=1 Tax=Metapseudomonas resinovorans TaxID=53412 RepID=A0ABT4Y443_METRE|nr:DNA-binding protein [Pseudomonas resinovorans]MDA8483623.1 Mu transposase C-terminal domain-containing protein [Pseudomonas resinovorans]
MRKWFTAQELAGLPGIPGTDRNVRLMAEREGWEGQRRLGSKAVEYSFSFLPAETQAALLARLVQQEEPQPAPQPTAPHKLISPQRDGISVSRLNDSQREVMTSRVAIIREIERMSQVVSQQRAIMTLVGLAREGQLSPYLTERVERANDRKTADRTLSERTLKRWLADYRKHGEVALAPARRKADLSVPAWAPVFLKHYQRPQKPSVEAAFEQFKAEYPGCPSIHAVRRFLAKLSPEAREQGRMGPRELKSIKAFKRRQADLLWPNDVWVADGHTFDAEVINPLTGQIFRPEVTMVIDWGTRRIVGFSVNLAESTIATLDTLRDGVSRVGMYKVLYVDNGSGFDNEVVYEVNDRLGGTITHSLPYNSQARGVIERPHKTILVRLAKTYDSYIGADMDKEAATRVHRLSRQQLAQGIQPTQIPTFERFFADLQNALNTYNYHPHRGLPKVRDLATSKMRHQCPMESWKSAESEGWEPLKADAAIVASLVRPQVVRTTHRAEVRFGGAVYFLAELEVLHGQEVRVAYDFRDASRVWVHTIDGELIGEALVDGNATPAMPQSLLDKATEKREQGQLARIVKKAKTLTGQDVELRVVPKAAQSAELPAEQLSEARRYAASLAPPQESTSAFEVPGDSMARYRLWKRLDHRHATGDALEAAETRWYRDYCNTQEFRSTQDMYDFAAAGQARA